MSDSLSKALANTRAYQQQRPAIVIAGVQALDRLIRIAQGDTGQSQVVGGFLLSLYNGDDYRFDLTALRTLDALIFEDCISVLLMDYQPEVEEHERIPGGNVIWKGLIKRWAPKAVTP